MKKLFGVSIFVSFILGFAAIYNWQVFYAYPIFLGGYLVFCHLTLWPKKTQTSEDDLLTWIERSQLWNEITTHFESVARTKEVKEFRVWCANINRIHDFEVFASKVIPLAEKLNLELKMLTTDESIKPLKKLVGLSAAQKIRFSVLDLKKNSWPFQFRFDLVYLGRTIDQSTLLSKGFHNRLEKCMARNSRLMVDPQIQESFLRNHWTASLPCLFKRGEVKPLFAHLRRDLDFKDQQTKSTETRSQFKIGNLDR